jgi:N-glycosylase/DNA lyase
MNKIAYPKINHQLTLLGGQSFAWDYIDGFYYGFTQNSIIKLRFDDKNETLEWQTYPEKDNFELINKYLIFDFDTSKVHSSFPTDDYLVESIKTYGKILILHQNFEEALLSYLVTPTNNIPSIRTRIRNMNLRLGTKLNVDGMDFYTFPNTEIIAEADLNILLESKLGFHAKHMKAAAQKIIEDGPKFKKQLEIPKAPNTQENLRYYLKTFSGIGNKVADCILVYGHAKYSEFPLDVWGQRILQNYYKLPENMKYEEMRAWTKEYFGEYAGWAGQYLFEYIRLKEGKYSK